MKDQVNGYPLLDEETVVASSEEEEEELHTASPRPATAVLKGPDHPETRLIRLLGKAWTCPVCLRPSEQPPPATA